MNKNVLMYVLLWLVRLVRIICSIYLVKWTRLYVWFLYRNSTINIVLVHDIVVDLHESVQCQVNCTCAYVILYISESLKLPFFHISKCNRLIFAYWLHVICIFCVYLSYMSLVLYKTCLWTCLIRLFEFNCVKSSE